MKIDQVENTEEFWIALVEDAVAKGHNKLSMPVTGLSKDAAMALAFRLNISVEVKGAYYIFSNTKGPRKGEVVH